MSRGSAPGDLVVMQGNLRPNVTRDCLALAEIERRNDGSQPVANLRGFRTMTGPWLIWSLVNRGEAVELAGGEAEEAARELCKKGAGAVVLTLGADGAAFFSADDTFHVAAPQVIAIDTVGAGDVFCGVLVAAKALGRSWKEALGRRYRSRFDFGHAKGCPCFLSVPGGDWRAILERAAATP